MIDRPLALAACGNKPELVEILLKNCGLGENGESYGGFHGAIKHKMFKLVRMFLERRCDLNEDYFNVTPLGACLTCRKNKSGDVRIVRLLLDAKADVLRLSKMCTSPYDEGELTTMLNVARAHSNSMCTALIQLASQSASKQQ